MLMQVTADDQPYVGLIELVEHSCSNRGQHARGTHNIVGWTFEEERLVQEQRSYIASSVSIVSSLSWIHVAVRGGDDMTSRDHKLCGLWLDFVESTQVRDDIRVLRAVLRTPARLGAFVQRE